jgi:hypothetical protein
VIKMSLKGRISNKLYGYFVHAITLGEVNSNEAYLLAEALRGSRDIIGDRLKDTFQNPEFRENLLREHPEYANIPPNILANILADAEAREITPDRPSAKDLYYLKLFSKLDPEGRLLDEMLSYKFGDRELVKYIYRNVLRPRTRTSQQSQQSPTQPAIYMYTVGSTNSQQSSRTQQPRRFWRKFLNFLFSSIDKWRESVERAAQPLYYATRK